MIVYYRMCNVPSTNPSPILQEDKYRLNKYCLKSFVRGYQDISPKVHFILDYCRGHYDEMISGNCPFEYTIEHTELGINGTCLRQYELARESREDIVLFQECDYVYLPDVGYKMMMAIKEFGIVSPYDHPDMYVRYDIHNRLNEIAIYANHHFRTATRNTMTFGIQNDIFKDNYDIFYKYGYLDGDVWYDLAKKNHRLWTPIPSLATHMVKDYMAPIVDWNL